MSCYNCQNSKMLEQPIDCDDYSIFGYCNKDKVIHPPPIYLPEGTCKYKKLKDIVENKEKIVLNEQKESFQISLF